MRPVFRFGSIIAAAALALTAGACDQGGQGGTGMGSSAPEAQVDLAAADGVTLEGEVALEQLPSGVRVVVDVEKAPPGPKGVHIHEKGDCSNIKGKSMGEHFAPQGKPHGLPNAAEHHLGDLGNLEVGTDGQGRLEIIAPDASLEEGKPTSFRGRAIVIHAKQDKGTQPSGDSGDPIACGVIEVG